jgi:acetylornithine deacetylase/succinyl-diaminopimelate desuccinylase-like protein
LDANGIIGGFTGEGSKAIIPARARAKLSFRLVPDQDPDAVLAALRQRVAELCPPTATFRFGDSHNAAPVLLPTDVPAMQAAVSALQDTFGRAPVMTRMGGSIPIVSLFGSVLGVPSILLGFGLPDDNYHAPNEKMNLSNVVNGIRAVRGFLQRLGQG